MKKKITHLNQTSLSSKPAPWWMARKKVRKLWLTCVRSSLRTWLEYAVQASLSSRWESSQSGLQPARARETHQQVPSWKHPSKNRNARHKCWNQLNRYLVWRIRFPNWWSKKPNSLKSVYMSKYWTYVLLTRNQGDGVGNGDLYIIANVVLNFSN